MKTMIVWTLALFVTGQIGAQDQGYKNSLSAFQAMHEATIEFGATLTELRTAFEDKIRFTQSDQERFLIVKAYCDAASAAMHKLTETSKPFSRSFDANYRANMNEIMSRRIDIDERIEQSNVCAANFKRLGQESQRLLVKAKIRYENAVEPNLEALHILDRRIKETEKSKGTAPTAVPKREQETLDKALQTRLDQLRRLRDEQMKRQGK